MPLRTPLSALNPGQFPAFDHYYRKVLGTRPIAYWPQWEASGTIARCLVNTAQNGSYVGPTLGGDGIGDGAIAPYYDGINDRINAQTAALAAAFNGVEGSLAIWLRISVVGVWTDGTVREPIRILVNGANLIIIQKQGGGGLTYNYTAGGVTEAFTVANPGVLTWIHMVMTWSKAADIMIGYYNGAVFNSSAALGVWAGVPTTCLISSNGGGGYWSGYLAHCAIWNRALAPGEVATLAVI